MRLLLPAQPLHLPTSSSLEESIAKRSIASGPIVGRSGWWRATYIVEETIALVGADTARNFFWDHVRVLRKKDNKKNRPQVAPERPAKRPNRRPHLRQKGDGQGAMRPTIDPSPGVGEVGPQREGGAVVRLKAFCLEKFLRRCQWPISGSVCEIGSE